MENLCVRTHSQRVMSLRELYSNRLNSFLQSDEWAHVKERHGWRVVRVAEGFLLTRRLAGILSFSYAPYFGVHKNSPEKKEATQENPPILSEHLINTPQTRKQGEGDPEEPISERLIQEFHRFYIDRLKSKKVRSGVLRWDLPYYFHYQDTDVSEKSEKKEALQIEQNSVRKTSPETMSEICERDLRCIGLIKSPGDVQMRHTLVMELMQSEEELLSQMKPKCRYNIRLAQKRGVQIDVCSVEDFYTLHQQTGIERGISVRSLSYMRDICALFGKDSCFCLGAYVNKRLVASIMVLQYKGSATYLFGGSNHEGQQTMANYAIQWEAIRHSKSQGADLYDFFGLHPHKQRYAGITRFKKMFGGILLERMGCWDIVQRPLSAYMMRLYEKIRRR